MHFGIITAMDNQTTVLIYESKKVLADNMVSYAQLIHDVSLQAGDVVYVMNVNRFSSVCQFMMFGKFCMENGVSLHVLAQPYLDLTGTKRWKPSVINLMRSIVDVERQAMARLSSAGKYTKEYWEYLCRTIEIQNLEVLGQIFASDGVMKRSR